MWDPIAWTVAFLLIVAVVLIVRAAGNKRYEKGGMTKPFLSGNVKEPEGTVGAGDVYWGFTHSFRWIIESLTRMHTGITNDYVGAFVVVLAILLVIILIL
jgi:hypothetical protein